MTNSIRVFLNTSFLYGKMVITTVIMLYLTRVVLEYLGVNDFGIYSLIGGVIALLSFISSALMVSTQRYLSVALGKKDSDRIKKVFSASIIIHAGMVGILVLILEGSSFFLFDGFLNIAPERLNSAIWVYQLMVCSTVFTVMTVPFNAAINAREDLWLFSIVETICAFLKLGVIVLFHFSKFDTLITYAAFMLAVTVANFIMKFVWCRFKYHECHNLTFRLRENKELVKEMLGFTGWNAFGTIALIGRNQGIAVIINIFWGTAINAVYGIANQVNGQLIYFSTMMTTSMTPQIMKSYGEGNIKRMMDLSQFTCKLAFFMSAVFAIPLLVEMDFVLGIWLKNVPAHTSQFCSLIVYMFLIMQLCPGLNRAIQATGKIRGYQILTSLTLLLPIPAGILVGYDHRSYVYILYAMIASQAIQLVVTTCISRKLLNLNVTSFALFVVKAVVVYIAIYSFGKYLYSICSQNMNGWMTFICVVISTMILFAGTYFVSVLSKSERMQMTNLVKTLLKRH